MRLLQRAVVVVLRPVYRAFFERPLWWFLAKVKAFFFAETLERLSLIENRLAALESPQNIEQLFRRAEASNAKEWDAIEQLLLALFRQPELRIAELSREAAIAPQVAAVSSATEPNRANAPNTIR